MNFGSSIPRPESNLNKTQASIVNNTLVSTILKICRGFRPERTALFKAKLLKTLTLTGCSLSRIPPDYVDWRVWRRKRNW